MNKLKESISHTIAKSSNGFKVKYIEELGTLDRQDIIALSNQLEPVFGSDAILTESNIEKYFNKNTFPFIAKLDNNLIGFIVGVPLEQFEEESWSHYDINLGKKNTIYTYIYLVHDFYRKKGGYSKTLKLIFLNWCRKNDYKYVTGHVKQGTAKKFQDSTKIVKIFPKWYNADSPFEYYRRIL